MNEPTFYQLLRYRTTQELQREAAAILVSLPEAFPRQRVLRDVELTARLYRGEEPGYLACDSEYHDLSHALHTFLALLRIVHGAQAAGSPFVPEEAALALTAALFHDAGYLRESWDGEGSGARYTREHVQRGIDLFRKLAPQLGYGAAASDFVELLIRATDLAVTIESLPFLRPQQAELGQLLDSADLLSQMADRTYLEKLLILYQEFRDAGIDLYRSENDLLKKTGEFYGRIEQRLAPIAARCDRYLRRHFADRWQLDLNPYFESMQRQREYLQQILHADQQNPKAFLRREGILERTARQRWQRQDEE